MLLISDRSYTREILTKGKYLTTFPNGASIYHFLMSFYYVIEDDTHAQAYFLERPENFISGEFHEYLSFMLGRLGINYN